MPMVKELLNGGVVTVRDGTLLREGELQQADDCILRPFTPAVYRAYGRTVYGQVLASTAVSSDTANTSTKLVTTTGNYTTAFVGQTLSGTNITGGTTVSAIIARTQSVIPLCVITGTTTVTAPSGVNFTLLGTGQQVRGAGVPAGTTITVVSRTTLTLSQASTNATVTLTFDPTITMSLAATGTGTVSVTFGAGTKVKGLAHTSYDDSSDQLLAYHGNNIFASVYTSATGTFTSLLTGLTDTGNEQMDVIHYSGAQFVLTGPPNRPKRVAYNHPTDGTAPILAARTVGMLPVGRAQSYDTTTVWSVATAAGTWSSILGNGKYWFLIVEAFNPDLEDGIEGTFIAYNDKDEANPVNLKSVSVTDYTTQKVRVTRHDPIVNDGSDGTNVATHWLIYMSPKQDLNSSDVPAITTFRRVAKVDVTQTFHDLTDTNTVSGATATSGTVGYPGTTAAGPTAHQFSNPNNMIGRANQTFADASANTTLQDATNKLRNFGAITAGAGTVTGIAVTLTGAWISDGNSSIAGGWISLSKDNGTTEAGVTRREFRFSASNRVAGPFFAGSITVGGPGDLWGTTWANADLADGTLAAIVGKIVTAHNDLLRVDTVGITVYAGGTVVNLNGPAFPVTVIQDSLGHTAYFGQNMPPPKASTGDVFEGQMVFNDPENPRTIRYSAPDNPEAFPPPYFLTFHSKRWGSIRLIRRVGPLMVIGLQNAIRRLTYLPRQDDPAFDPGRCFEDVNVHDGVVGGSAAVVIDMGRGPELVYVSMRGLRVTDGMTDRPLNEDLDFVNAVSQANLSICVLKNNVANYSIEFYYTPFGGSSNTKRFSFSYHPMHTKPNGMLPAMGPISVNARCAATGFLSDVPTLLTGHTTDGKVYNEDTGTSDAAGGTIAPTIRTRQIYHDDISHKTRVERIYVRASAFGLTFTVSSTTTSGSTAVTSAALFGSVTVGMYVSGIGIQPGTKVSAVTNSSNITLNQSATASGVVTLTFSSGAIELTLRRQNIGEAATDLRTVVADTSVGGLVRTHLDGQAEAHEVKIAKVATVDAHMAIQYFGYDVVPHGKEQSDR